MEAFNFEELCLMADHQLPSLYHNMTTNDRAIASGQKNATAAADTMPPDSNANSSGSSSSSKSYEDFLSDHNALCDKFQLEAVISWIVPVIFAIIVIVGVIGNSLVLFVVTCWQQMRNTTNVLILVSCTNVLVLPIAVVSATIHLSRTFGIYTLCLLKMMHLPHFYHIIIYKPRLPSFALFSKIF